VEWTIHPPLEIGRLGRPPGPAALTFLHVHLWLRAVLDDWDERLEGHVHFIARLSAPAAAGPWMNVRFDSHTFSPAPPETPVPPDLPGLLDAGCSSLGLDLYRVRELGVVSELGEPVDAFRSRVLGLMRPEIQKHLEERAPGGESAARRIAPAVAAVAHGIERRRLEPLDRFAARREGGILLLAPDVAAELARGRRRPPDGGTDWR